MRRIKKSRKLKIYLNTAPLFIGEFFCVGGVMIPIFTHPDLEGLIGLAFFIVGFFVVRRKVRTMNSGFHILQYGERAEAVIDAIENTSFKHNSRTVKDYRFRYKVEGKSYSYHYRSAYKRQLEIGDDMKIYYIKSNPQLSFIPKLYNVTID